ncbi:MAG TPA: HEAT repeat domain-containing protein, partial [Gemmatimonadaceae bacterium]|nr:HEAT repeat domain-containing protein [Gemmatimonadaceae bacterium]
ASVIALAGMSPWREPASSPLADSPLPAVAPSESAPSPEVADTTRMTFAMRPGQWLEILTVWGTVTALPASANQAEVVIVKKSQAGGRKALDRVLIQKGENDAGWKICARYPKGAGHTPCTVRGRAGYDATDVITTVTVRVPKGVKLEAHTVMGNVVATGLDSYAWATSTMGNLVLSTTAYAEGSTSAGNITALLGATTWDDNMEFETGGGHVVVEVPADVRTNVEGEADRGAIGSDFELKFRDVNDTGWLVGTLGRNGATRSYLTMRSKQGNVFLRRASGRQSLDMGALDSLARIGTPGIRGAVVPVEPGTSKAAPVLDNEPPGGSSPASLDAPYRITAGGETDERVALDVPGGFLRRFTPQLLKGKRDSVAITKLAGAATARWIAFQNGEVDPGTQLVGDRAIWALTKVRDGQVQEGLFAALGDADWRVRAYAAWALAEVGEWAAGPLYDALGDPEWRVRMHAAVAMGNLRAKPAVRTLIRLLEDEHFQVRSAAAAALGEIGDRSALPALRKAVRDPHAMVRSEAEAAVERLGG